MPTTYLIAQFSDFHLSDTTDVEFHRALAMVDDAIEQGADHLVFCGDLVNSQQMKTASAFMRALKKRRYGTANKFSIVPGNHDISPGRELRLPKHPDAVFRQFNRITSASRSGEPGPLFTDAPYPYGKVLSRNVVLVCIDTTVGGIGPGSAVGNLDEGDIDAAKEFFDEHSDAQHRIVVMHHYPYKANYADSEWVNMEFESPDAATVRSWLGWAGATLVLCGHCHSTEDRRMPKGVRVLCNGTSGGDGQDEDDDGSTQRSYTLIELGGSRRIKTYDRWFSGNELCGDE